MTRGEPHDLQYYFPPATVDCAIKMQLFADPEIKSCDLVLSYMRAVHKAPTHVTRFYFNTKVPRLTQHTFYIILLQIILIQGSPQPEV